MIDPSGSPDPPLGMPDPPRSWFEFWVRFAFGALFAFVVSGFLWLRWFWRMDFSWIIVPASTLIGALAAARYGDLFWMSLRARRWWWY
ncbi:MAG: hypothetical protein ACJ8NS_15020 [Chthoniobacterales bacterium]